MEKIKASEVLAIIKKNYKFLSIDTDGAICISSCTPYADTDDEGNVMWLPEVESKNEDSLLHIDTQLSISTKESLSSVREIDFSEDFTEERLSLIDRITSYLAKELSLRDYNRIKGFFEEMEKPDYTKGFVKSLDLEKEAPTKEPSSIFKIDDTVHVLSYSNIGEFGKSTEGIIKTVYKDGTVLVKVEEGIEEVHKEDNVSFTPFSIKEAGFSQVRPVQDPKIGDWGFFYDNKNPYWFTYSELGAIKKNTSNDTLYFAECGGCYLRFSIEPPQLTEGVPNPFKEC